MAEPGSAVVVGVGASNGLGAALARRFAREGRPVYLAGRTAERLERVAGEIRAEGGVATPVAADATQEGQVQALFERVERDGPPLELAAYNAGNNRMQPILEMDAAFFEEAWRVGCLGGFLVGREAARVLVPRGRGSILFTGATASLKGRPPFTAFASAKAALRSLAQSMARELGPQGIHVAHVVIDGMIEGEVVRSRFPQILSRKGEDGALQPEAIADAFWAIHAQHRSAWTHELDLRPFKETW